jgi:Skp family chaperone for outer membrane proteins
MRIPLIAAAAFAFGAAAALTLQPGAGTAQNVGPNRPEKIGYVDLEYIFDNYEKKGDVEKGLDEEARAIEKRLEPLKKDIAELEAQLKNITGWPAQEKVIKLIIDKKADGLRIQELSRLQLEVKMNELTNGISREIDGALKVYVASAGYTLILRKNVKLDLSAAAGRRLPPIHRDIVYSADAQHDLTKPVLDMLNRKYREGKAKGG